MTRVHAAVLTIAAAVVLVAAGGYWSKRTPRQLAGSTSGVPVTSASALRPVSTPDSNERARRPVKVSLVPVASARDPSPSAADLLVEEAREIPPDRVAEAKKLLSDALDADPRHVGALRQLSEIHLEEEAYDAAINLANRCLEAEPSNVGCTDIRLMALGRSGRHDVAATERAYLERPDDFGRVQGLAQERLAAGRLAEAKVLIEKMRAIDPENALVPTMLGDLDLREGDVRAALAEFELACRMGQEYACKSAARLRARPSP